MIRQADSPLPAIPLPIYIIGAGGIVNDAHLPAYAIAGFTVSGIYDVDKQKAIVTAEKFKIQKVFDTLEEMITEAGIHCVFDIALPADAIQKVLSQLPEGAKVLMQKPMGDSLVDAKKILQVSRERKQIVAVNFQLRYAPFIVTAKSIVDQGLIGQLCDIEVNINVYTPWHLWSFLNSLPRVEILYHSIHYVDLVRSFLGNPLGIYAKTIKHPLFTELASVRTNIIMDYGDLVRANILTNHTHNYGLHNQESYIKLEGTKGAIKIKLGTLMDYPKGIEDTFEYVILEDNQLPTWKTLDIKGSWFPHAFIGSMSQVMLAAEGSIAQPDNSVADCIYTMACVEAAYISSQQGATVIEGLIDN